MPSSARRTIDPDGRLVILDERAIGHLNARGRSPIADDPEAILETVARPDHRELDPVPGRERFYRRNPFGPRWLRVVVDFSGEAYVVTAFAQRRDSSSL